jgi:hypothetical protein
VNLPPKNKSLFFLAALFAALSGTGCAHKKPALEAKAAPASDQIKVPVYENPEKLVEDYKNAMGHFVYDTTRWAFNVGLVNYFACRAFAEKTPAACAGIDAFQPKDPSTKNAQGPLPAYLCESLYWEGLMLKEMTLGGGDFKSCFMEDAITGNHKRDEGHVTTGEELEDECRTRVAFFMKGDLKGYCAFQKANHDKGLDYRDPEAFCREYAYMTGDAEKCKGSPQEAFCVARADLLKAVRKNRPELVKGSFYEPLVNPAADCSAFAADLLFRFRQSAIFFVQSKPDREKPEENKPEKPIGRF